jgi:hypothetical protein
LQAFTFYRRTRLVSPRTTVLDDRRGEWLIQDWGGTHLPDAVLFEECDGIFWLTGQDLDAVRAAGKRAYDGERIGFDACEAQAHASVLRRLGIRVGIRRGDTVRFLREHVVQGNRRVVTGKPLFLKPEALVESKELVRLESALNRKQLPHRVTFERWRTALTTGDSDLPFIGVFAMAGMFDVDWQTTELTPESFGGSRWPRNAGMIIR